MLEQIRQFLRANPFTPFDIRTSDGREYHIPTADHAHIRPGEHKLYVYLDDGRDAVISTLHLASVLGETAAQEPAEQA